MYEIHVYYLLKVRLGVLKVSLCITLYLAFFGAIWFFLRIDLAFFAHHDLATLLLSLACGVFTKIGHVKPLRSSGMPSVCQRKVNYVPTNLQTKFRSHARLATSIEKTFPQFTFGRLVLNLLKIV